MTIAIQLFMVLVGITVHEAAHAWASSALGDPTAKNQGRMSLNPIRHIDPVGTVLVPLVLVIAGAPAFGWAKPVPINPAYYRDHRVGMMLSGLAGPASNLLLAALLGLGYQIGVLVAGDGAGSGTLAGALAFVFGVGVIVNTFLAAFNLIPIPPLDGSRVVPVIVPSLARTWDELEQYGFLLFFVVVFVLPRLAPGLDVIGFAFERVALPLVRILTGWLGVAPVA